MQSAFDTEPELTAIIPKEKVFHYLDSLKDGKIAGQFFVNHSLQEEFCISQRAANRLYWEWLGNLG